VVRKEGQVVNSFPYCEDQEGLRQAVGHVREQAWKAPTDLVRQRTAARASRLRSKLSRRRQSEPDE
jgi:hypothetical protein